MKYLYALAMLFCMVFGLLSLWMFLGASGPMFFKPVPIAATGRVMVVWFLSGIGSVVSMTGLALFHRLISEED